MKRRVAIVCLSRTGDIISALPLGLHLSSDADVFWYVSPEHKAILEAVSYVKPVVWTRSNKEALEDAYARSFNEVINAQNAAWENGPDGRIVTLVNPKQKANYQLEQWRVTGYGDVFPDLPLVFDQRQKLGEEAAVEMLQSRGKIGYSLRGFTSSFNASNELWRWAERTIPDVVRIDANNLPKVHHLLGVIENLKLLVSINSAPLHMAYAFPELPIIALYAGYQSAYHHSVPRKNWVLSMTYEETLTEAGQEKLLNTIKEYTNVTA